MKDASHHLRHIQKKVIQEARKQHPLEGIVLTAETSKPEVELNNHEKKHPRHIPAPRRVKSPMIH